MMLGATIPRVRGPSSLFRGLKQQEAVELSVDALVVRGPSSLFRGLKLRRPGDDDNPVLICVRGPSSLFRGLKLKLEDLRIGVQAQ